MKYYLLLSTLFFLFEISVFGQPGGSSYFNTQPKDTIFTKNQITVLNSSGDTIEISDFKNGKIHGIQKLFFNNSELRYKADYKNGLLDGKAETFQQNRKSPVKIEHYKSIPAENRSVLDGLSQVFDFEGILLEEINYKNGLKDGKYKLFHSNGKLKQEGTYQNNLDTGRKKTYDANGFILKDENFIIIDNPDFVKLNPSKLPEEIPEKPKSLLNVPEKLSVLNGKVKYYFSEGKISNDLNFKNGLKEGLNKEFYQNQTGSPRSEVYFKDGKEHGPFVYYRIDGNVEKKGIYYAEIKVGDTVLKNVYDGENIFYQENGKRSRLENWKNYKRNGVFETYVYQSGELSTRMHFIDDLKSGKEQHFDKNGQMAYEVNYEIREIDGQKVSQKSGLQRTWENGSLKSTVEWANDQMQGISKVFYPNGNIEKIAYYKDGFLDGTYQTFYENGQLKQDLIYYINPKTKTSAYINWGKSYDENGVLNTVFFGEKNDKKTVEQKFKNGKELSLYVNDIFCIQYSEVTGKIEEIEFSAGQYTTVLGFRSFSNGSLRRMNFTNMGNHSLIANFSSNGELIQIKGSAGVNTESAELKNLAKEIAKQYNTSWTKNPPISILENNGNSVYEWNYADNKPFFRIEFKDSLPNGKWMLFNPISNDSLFLGEFKKGKPIGKWIKKRMDGSFVYQKLYDDSSILIENKQYNEEGNLQEHKKNNSQGTNELEIIYYSNGKVRDWRNALTKSYIHFSENGDTLSYNLLKPGKDSIAIRRDFFAGNIIRLDEKQSRINGNGIKRIYFEDGTLRFYQELKNWKKDGNYEEYNEFGKLIRKGDYIADKREGKWINFDSDGTEKISYFENDELVIPKENRENESCKCYDTTLNKSKIGFANSLKNMSDFQVVKQYIPKTIIPVDDFNYEKIFYLGNNFNSDRNYGYAQFRMLPLAGFSFYYPTADYLKFDLIPCSTEGYVNNIDVSISYSNSEKSVSYASLYPRRILVELMNNPLKDSETKGNFKAYFDTDGMTITENGITSLNLKKDKIACFSKGLINDFIQIEVLDAEIQIQPNQLMNVGNLPLESSELSKFYGLEILQSKIEFKYIENNTTVSIQSAENQILAGSNFVAGEISLEGKRLNDNEFQLINGLKIQPELLKEFLEQKGFYRVKTVVSDNNLMLMFYAEK